MSVTVEELTLAQAQRGLECQERSWAELRQRTGTLVAVVALVGPLLVELGPAGGVDAWTIAALACLATTLGLGLSILWPRKLTFALDPNALYEKLWENRDDVAMAQRRLAEALWRARKANLRTIDPLHRRYAAAVALLAAAVALGTVAVIA